MLLFVESFVEQELVCNVLQRPRRTWNWKYLLSCSAATPRLTRTSLVQNESEAGASYRALQNCLVGEPHNLFQGVAFRFEMVFSDEKHFNLDRLDGRKNYWRNVRDEKPHFSKGARVGQSVMVWAFIFLYVVGKLLFLGDEQDSRKYRKSFETGLFPFAAELFGK